MTSFLILDFHFSARINDLQRNLGAKDIPVLKINIVMLYNKSKLSGLLLVCWKEKEHYVHEFKENIFPLKLLCDP